MADKDQSIQAIRTMPELILDYLSVSIRKLGYELAQTTGTGGTINLFVVDLLASTFHRWGHLVCTSDGCTLSAGTIGAEADRQIDCYYNKTALVLDILLQTLLGDLVPLPIGDSTPVEIQDKILAALRLEISLAGYQPVENWSSKWRGAIYVQEMYVPLTLAILHLRFGVETVELVCEKPGSSASPKASIQASYSHPKSMLALLDRVRQTLSSVTADDPRWAALANHRENNTGQERAPQ